jgi:hypothetical protein
MSRKQATPSQLNTLEKIKRKARASQEARLQRTLDRLTRQEQEPSSTNTPNTSTSHDFDPRRTTVKYYAVRRGRTNNAIYVSWALCKNQVLNYPGAEFKAFNTYEAAQEYLDVARPVMIRGEGRSHIVDSTQPKLSATVDATTQTARNRGFQTYIEGVALGVIIGAIATLWILLPQQVTRML